ncbi:hypothetical protein, partial [Variovorax paradoxus]|uniref:hypothetical protein n=1 Tax=Variovorax paradoxus TaxID=34073 RepID=UPI001C0A80C4
MVVPAIPAAKVRWLSGNYCPELITALGQSQLLWILDPANRHIVDANAASAALLFQHLLMPADR